jgi:predicted nucleotide-binding protein
MLGSNPAEDVRRRLEDLKEQLFSATHTTSLEPLLRRAADLAHRTQQPEYASVFELHLDGVRKGEEDGEGRLTKWVRDGAPPRWNPVQAFFQDRAMHDGRVQGASLPEFELIAAGLEDALRTDRDDDGRLFIQVHEARAIKARIRNRIHAFLTAVQANLAAAPGPPPVSAQDGGAVFIGHGRSLLWMHLKEFLQERLKLRVSEFNRESVAGISTQERLQTLLGDARFAFLVFTAEDKDEHGNAHARLNVVHEAGLFQGRLGFPRAIIVLEDGCAEFSNIVGLGQIRFSKGNIAAAFEEVRRVLEREQVIS